MNWSEEKGERQEGGIFIISKYSREDFKCSKLQWE